MKKFQYIKRDLIAHSFQKQWTIINKQTHVIDFKCTPGVGDFMYILSVAYMRSFILSQQVTLNLNWYHDKDFLYHFEDPETILERFEYINNFYLKDNTDVLVNHIFNSDNSKLYLRRYRGFQRGWDKSLYNERFIGLKYNSWEFRESSLKVDPDKIVIWNQLQNAQQPRPFKRPFERQGWDQVIKRIEAHGYDVVEIDYRTPIREALYHIATCRATVSYEGMWHYIAKNYHKPMIVLTQDNITKYHTPNALIYQVKKREQHDYNWFNDFDKHLEKADKLARRGERLLRSIHKKVEVNGN